MSKKEDLTEHNGYARKPRGERTEVVPIVACCLRRPGWDGTWLGLPPQAPTDPFDGRVPKSHTHTLAYGALQNRKYPHREQTRRSLKWGQGSSWERHQTGWILGVPWGAAPRGLSSSGRSHLGHAQHPPSGYLAGREREWGERPRSQLWKAGLKMDLAICLQATCSHL